MGTSIVVLFTRDLSLPIDAFSTRLSRAFDELASELAKVKQHAWYSCEPGSWDVIFVPEHGGEPPYLTTEGPYGFSVDIYDNVVCLGSAERFEHLRSPDSPVATPLQRVIHSVVTYLSPYRTVFATVAGGMGDSDRPVDLAYYNAATFNDVCNCLRQTLGEPATSWYGLNQDGVCWGLVDAVHPPTTISR
jgi:hypothetical protein